MNAAAGVVAAFGSMLGLGSLVNGGVSANGPVSVVLMVAYGAGTLAASIFLVYHKVYHKGR